MTKKHFVFVCASILMWTSMAQTVQNGMVDLSQYDFTKNGPFALNGSWVFYPDALLSKSPSNDSLSIQVPGSWEKADLPAIGFGTYELTIIQQSDVSLGLDLPNIHSALNLYVNDQLVVSKGQVSIAKDSTIPYRQVRLVPLFNFGDTLHLRIEVANFHHSRGGVDDPIVIGNYLDLSRTRQLENVLDVFLTGCLVMGSFLFLGLYFFGRRQVVALFFGLFCLSYGYRIIGSGSYILHDYFYVPHWLSIRLEYAAIYLSGYFFAEYVRHLFPKETPRYLISFFCYFSLLWAALTLLPPTLFTQLNTIYLFVLLMAILTMALVYIRAVLNRQVGAGYSVFSTIGMLIVFSVKVLAYLHVIEEPKMVTMAGQLVFFLFQSLILPDRFSTAWRRSTEAAKTANEELKATQNQLIESEKMATIGILTAGLAHELNNPLNVIGGVIGPIKRDLKEIQVNGKGKAKKKEVFQEIDNLLDHVSESAKRATQVIRNLLDITPKGGGEDYQRIDLKELIESTSVLIQKGQGTIDFRFNFEDGLIIKGNPVELNQVFLNLIRNGIDALLEADNPTIFISGKKTEEHVELVFTDNGMGMKDSTIKKVFEPFFTTKSSKGTGLGLYISRSIVLKHSGTMEVKSKTGVGTSIILSFPQLT